MIIVIVGFFTGVAVLATWYMCWSIKEAAKGIAAVSVNSKGQDKNDFEHQIQP